MVLQWAYMDRLVCGDSYFAPVKAAKALLCLCLAFIGVVKQATCYFLMTYLCQFQLGE